jgi:class 3 adenylate cyclase
MTEQRRLAAIVSADVAGYSRLMGRDESGTLAALKAFRHEVWDPTIAYHGGRIVKTTGDGLLLEFPSVVNAVRCAVEVQSSMADRTALMAEDQRITFRIGINMGDIIVDGDDIFGDGVNVAARLQEIAAAGGICMAATGAAEPCLRRSIEIARRQKAKSLELRAAMVLGRHWQRQGRRRVAHDLLAPILGCFSEGFDTPDLQKAKALLHDLA